MPARGRIAAHQARAYGLYALPPNGTPGGLNLQAYLFKTLFAGWTSGYLASLTWSALFLLAMFLGAWALYARRIIFKL